MSLGCQREVQGSGLHFDPSGEGIAALVNAESDMKLVAEATNGQNAIEKF